MTSTRTYHKSRRLGRLQIGYVVYIHGYPTSGDRWVIRPELIWDRK